MRALYLFFADTADPDLGRSSTTEATRLVDDEPLTPIEPGAFSRWMASRERLAAEARDAKVIRLADIGAPGHSRPARGGRLLATGAGIA
jgi:hypothetical protein